MRLASKIKRALNPAYCPLIPASATPAPHVVRGSPTPHSPDRRSPAARGIETAVISKKASRKAAKLAKRFAMSMRFASVCVDLVEPASTIYQNDVPTRQPAFLNPFNPVTP